VVQEQLALAGLLAVGCAGLRAVDCHHARTGGFHQCDHRVAVEPAPEIYQPPVVDQRDVEPLATSAHVHTQPHGYLHR